MENTSNSILVDWFSATTSLYDFHSLVAYLGLNSADFTYMPGRGRYFFADRYQCGHINIYSSCRLNSSDENYFSGIMIEMSGQGCREFESFGGDFDKVFQDVAAGDFKCTRVDIAYDDIDKEGAGLLDIAKICLYTSHQRFTSKWAKVEVIDTCKVSSDEMKHARSVTFGSRQSDIMLRIYDKAAERGGLDYHWNRVELQFRRDRACELIDLYTKSHDIGTLFYGVLRNYLRFIRKDHTRRERCSTVGWWEKFLNNVAAIRLFTKHDTEYNLLKARSVCKKMYGNTIETVIRCVGAYQFLKDIATRTSKLNPNQRLIIQQEQATNAGAAELADLSLYDIFKITS